MTAEFRLRNVIKTFAGREVLNIDHLVMPGQKIYTILGPNGSGKTTLMRTMALLLRNDAGSIIINGEKINWSKKQLLRLRRDMTMVTQNAFMFEDSVYANVAYGLKVRRKPDKQIRSTVEECLNMVGMSSFGRANARGLSAGEIQKVAIARALAVKPKILFLDEPTSNIDPGSALDIEKFIRLINRDMKVSIIMVTHNLFQARRLSDEIIFMWDGKIIDRGTTEEMFTRPSDDRTRSFLKGDTVF
jgi:tungstate transport system ATP-binding protein